MSRRGSKQSVQAVRGLTNIVLVLPHWPWVYVSQHSSFTSQLVICAARQHSNAAAAQGLHNHHKRSSMHIAQLAEGLCLHLDATCSEAAGSDSHPAAWEAMAQLLLAAARRLLSLATEQRAGEGSELPASKRQRVAADTAAEPESSIQITSSSGSGTQESDTDSDSDSHQTGAGAAAGQARSTELQQRLETPPQAAEDDWGALQVLLTPRARWWGQQHFQLSQLHHLQQSLSQSAEPSQQQGQEFQHSNSSLDPTGAIAAVQELALQTAHRAVVAAFVAGAGSTFPRLAGKVLRAGAQPCAVAAGLVRVNVILPLRQFVSASTL